MMRVIYCRDRGLSSRLIRGLTWSPWSHVGLVDGSEVVEALPGAGVQAVSLASVQARGEWVLDTLPCRDPRAALEAARSQLGKPYDWRALGGILVHRDWQDPARWFCSELVAWSILLGGTELFRPGTPGVKPGCLWRLGRG